MDNPIEPEQVADILSEDPGMFLVVGLDRLASAWEALTREIDQMLFGAGGEDDEDFDVPSPDSLALAAVIEEDMEGVDEEESSDDSALVLFRKRDYRLRFMAETSVERPTLLLFGQTLEVLWSAFMEIGGDQEVVEEIFANLRTPLDTDSSLEDVDELGEQTEDEDADAPAFVSLDELGEEDSDDDEF